MPVIETTYIANSYNASGRGCCWQTFAALPNDQNGYHKAVRIDRIDGAMITKHAQPCPNRGRWSAYERKADGVVEVDLPYGTIIKRSPTQASEPGYKTHGSILRPDGTLEDIRFIGNKRSGNDWLSVFEADGRRLEIQ